MILRVRFGPDKVHAKAWPKGSSHPVSGPLGGGVGGMGRSTKFFANAVNECIALLFLCVCGGDNSVLIDMGIHNSIISFFFLQHEAVQ